MAIREIRVEGDDILRKECKPYKEVNKRTLELIEDMFDTMYEAAGVGLAGPQVGIMKQIFVVDCGAEEPEQYVFINPVILELEGEQTGQEGCLSVPNKTAVVKRAEKVRVRAYNENMELFELEAEGLLARCIQHENDHLHGILYIDKAEPGTLKEFAEEPETEEEIRELFEEFTEEINQEKTEE